ncbi:hypothetical protein C8A00DRAFT_44382 [Chaetomidium leptoderma]|uniref:Uncharacterized protein n=1 Tax=Chaetomidium leptoderma TaxID=669021 RepID=A0AAN6ZXL3_9PEZI|nr:hypothetical protein C8A00DRAFT_44382 [Chaetomidium leptoderma]
MFTGYPSPDSSDEGRRRARYRRAQATSSDSSDAGEFEISNVRFRVGAPPPLPLPLDNSRHDIRCKLVADELGQNVIMKEAAKILAAEKIRALDVALVSRGDPEIFQGPPTVLIVARWEEGCAAAWERAVRGLKKFVDSRRLKSDKLGHLDIAVEIIAEELTLRKYVSVVPAKLLAQGLEKDWAFIKDKVFQILESHSGTKGLMTAINLFRLGFSPCDDENANTVYISVDYESDEAKWPPVVAEIQQYLEQYNRHSEVKRNQRQHLYNNMMPKTPYKTAVDLGDDIGVSNYLTASDGQKLSPIVGTLGCWLEVKSKKFPDWTKVALTNYHIIRPAYDGFRVSMAIGGPTMQAPERKSDLWKRDANGVVPTASAPKLEHPTRAKHNHGAQSTQDMVSSFPGEASTKKHQDNLDQMVAFFDQGKHLLGTVYAASGYIRRTANNGRLDWALILPLDKARIGRNALPSADDWFGRFSSYITKYPKSTFGKSLRQTPPAGLRSLGHGENVYKVGASTRHTIGEFNRMKSDLTIAEDKHVTGISEEFAFVASATTDDGDGRFATIGDSGSVVWNKEGQAVGLLLRGQKPQQSGDTSLVYVTPIEDVFADIKAFSKGEITEIRIAKD